MIQGTSEGSCASCQEKYPNKDFLKSLVQVHGMRKAKNILTMQGSKEQVSFRLVLLTINSNINMRFSHWAKNQASMQAVKVLGT